ncbi:MAG: RHS repeat protein, partial [Anaerolineae bacterium]|nr:RHS repeat protein [Anaerolineae bacterium]
TLQDLSYSYDPVGNVASITDGQGPGGAQQVQQFGYDSLDRLVSAEATGGAGGTYDHEYEYTHRCMCLSRGKVKQSAGFGGSSPPPVGGMA